MMRWIVLVLVLGFVVLSMPGCISLTPEELAALKAADERLNELQGEIVKVLAKVEKGEMDPAVGQLHISAIQSIMEKVREDTKPLRDKDNWTFGDALLGALVLAAGRLLSYAQHGGWMRPKQT